MSFLLNVFVQAVERTDEEYQLDDVFMNRAAKKQSEAQIEEKDRSKAIQGNV